MISRRALAIGLAGMLLLPAGIAMGSDQGDDDQAAVVAQQDRDRVRSQDRSECESCDNEYLGAQEQVQTQVREQTQTRTQVQDETNCDGDGAQLRQQSREEKRTQGQTDPPSGNGAGAGYRVGRTGS